MVAAGFMLGLTAGPAQAERQITISGPVAESGNAFSRFIDSLLASMQGIPVLEDLQDLWDEVFVAHAPELITHGVNVLLDFEGYRIMLDPDLMTHEKCAALLENLRADMDAFHRDTADWNAMPDMTGFGGVDGAYAGVDVPDSAATLHLSGELGKAIPPMCREAFARIAQIRDLEAPLDLRNRIMRDLEALQYRGGQFATPGPGAQQASDSE